MTDHRLDCQEFPHKVNLLNFTSFFSSDRNNLIVLLWSDHVKNSPPPPNPGSAILYIRVKNSTPPPPNFSLFEIKVTNNNCAFFLVLKIIVFCNNFFYKMYDVLILLCLMVMALPRSRFEGVKDIYTGYCLDISWSTASNLSWPALSLQINSSRYPGSRSRRTAFIIFNFVFTRFQYDSIVWVWTPVTGSTKKSECGSQLQPRKIAHLIVCPPLIGIHHRAGPNVLVDDGQQGGRVPSFHNLHEASGRWCRAIYHAKDPGLSNRGAATVVLARQNSDSSIWTIHLPGPPKSTGWRNRWWISLVNVWNEHVRSHTSLSKSYPIPD